MEVKEQGSMADAGRPGVHRLTATGSPCVQNYDNEHELLQGVYIPSRKEDTGDNMYNCPVAKICIGQDGAPRFEQIAGPGFGYPLYTVMNTLAKNRLYNITVV